MLGACAEGVTGESHPYTLITTPGHSYYYPYLISAIHI